MCLGSMYGSVLILVLRISMKAFLYPTSARRRFRETFGNLLLLENINVQKCMVKMEYVEGFLFVCFVCVFVNHV